MYKSNSASLNNHNKKTGYDCCKYKLLNSNLFSLGRKHQTIKRKKNRKKRTIRRKKKV